MRQRGVASCLVLAGILSPVSAQRNRPGLTTSARLNVSLTASSSPPVPVGQMVTWTASVSGTGSTNIWYQFEVLPASAAGGSAAALPLGRGFTAG